jgi:uncharacterized OB-fold protein
MKRATMILSWWGLVLPLAMSSWAQVTKEAKQTVTVAGTVEAIDTPKRHLTIKKDSGGFVTLDVPQSVKRFDELKVGDKVRVTYDDHIKVRLKEPNEAAVDRAYVEKTAGTGEAPEASASMLRIMTATVTDIDKSTSSITIVGPDNWKYSRRVLDPTVFDKVKVGDRVDIIWSTDVTVTAN